MQFSLTKPN